MKPLVFLYGATGAVFWPLDLLWLGIVAKDLYRSRLGDMLLPQPNLAAAAAFYLIYVVGIVVFAGRPALASDSWLTALGLGMLFGFLAYATYDLTNLATLKDWPLALSLVDMAWGAVLTGTAAALGFLIARAALRYG